MRLAGFAVELPCEAAFFDMCCAEVVDFEEAHARQRVGSGFWESIVDGVDKIVPGFEAVFEVGLGPRSPPSGILLVEGDT